jgi:hypothetical protein
MEKDAGKERGWEPYEPLGPDRPRLAVALRGNIMTSRLDGSEHIARFMRGGRFKVTLPVGENLLKYATFDSLGTHEGKTRIRAFVSIPCPPDRPYRDVVEFTFVPEEWDMPRTIEDKAPEPEQASPEKTTVGGYALKTKAAIAGLLALTAVVGLEMSGRLDIREFIKSWREPAATPTTSTKNPGDTPPAVPPVVIPNDPWGLSRR